MSTTHHQIADAREFTGENSLRRETMFFSGNVAPGLATRGPLFPWLRALDFTKKTKLTTSNNWHRQANAKSFPFSALRGRWSIWRDAPAMPVCCRLWQNALARLHAAKHEWCCEAPGTRDCSWKLLNALYQLCKTEFLTIVLHLCGIAAGGRAKRWIGLQKLQKS